MNVLPRIRIALATLLVIGFAPAIQGATLDPDDPDDVIRMSLKTSCSLNDLEAAVYWWEGRMYSRVPGEKDRLLFNVTGMNTRHCVTMTDEVRGLGYRSRSRELMLYLDPETDEVLRTWTNPWTGTEVEVIHVANDPPGFGRAVWARDENGEPARTNPYIFKDGVALSGGGAARLFYENPLGGDYQPYVGGWYHAMEFLTGSMPVDDLLDADASNVSDRIISWGRVSKFLPWMEMGDRPGVMIFHTAGLRLENWDQLPEVLKKEIRENYPIYTDPPPIDYDKPRETTWTVVKKVIDERRAQEAESGK
jgi:hypothetical protein